MKPSDFEDSLRKTYEEATNTPDTEWEERFNEIYPSVTVGYDGSEMDARKRAKVWQFIEDEITTLNARHHTTITSRDTYWKERVRKVIEDKITYNAQYLRKPPKDGETNSQTKRRRANNNYINGQRQACDDLLKALDNLK